MTESLNSFVGIGGLPRDAKEITVQSGTVLFKFAIGADRRYQDRAGVWKTETDWVNVHRFVGKDSVVRYREMLRKGARVMVEGSLETRAYEVQGEKRTETSIAATTIRWLNPPLPTSLESEGRAPMQEGPFNGNEEF